MDEPQPLLWLDLEMTGLEPETCQIIEIAILVTDENLRTLAEGPSLVIHADDSALEAMDAWCTEHHGASGLTAAVRASMVSAAEAESLVLEFVRAHTKAGGSPMCGNSIGQDRRFLAKHMPKLEAHFHYRNVDVSTVKELARRWYPDLPKFEKKETHRAIDDIRESIAELSYYRNHLFR